MIEILLLMALHGQVTQRSAIEPPPKIAKLLELCETSRRGAILQIEHKLRGLRQQGKADDAANGTTSAETSGKVAELERELKFLRTDPLPVLPTLSFPPQVGTIGRLPGESCHIDQVVTTREMLVRCFFQVPVVTVQNFKGQREIVEESIPCVIRGLDTSQAREGTDFETEGLYEVVGSETYQTASGKPRQLVVLRPFDRRLLERHLPTAESR